MARRIALLKADFISNANSPPALFSSSFFFSANREQDSEHAVAHPDGRGEEERADDLREAIEALVVYTQEAKEVCFYFGWWVYCVSIYVRVRCVREKGT